MKPRAIATRLCRVLDALDARLERQTLRPGADAVHIVSTVGLFHEAAGRLERRANAWPCAELLAAVRERAAFYAGELRVLRRIVRAHHLMVELRGTRLRNARAT